MANKCLLLFTVFLSIFLGGCSNPNIEEREVLKQLVFRGENDDWIGSIIVIQEEKDGTIFRQENYKLAYKQNPSTVNHLEYYTNINRLGENGTVNGSRKCSNCLVAYKDSVYAVYFILDGKKQKLELKTSKNK
jgi:hypothetical protein